MLGVTLKMMREYLLWLNTNLSQKSDRYTGWSNDAAAIAFL